MTRPVAVLRPEPGNSQTVARLAERGLTAIRFPLFDVVALNWALPDPDEFDALLLTSANAARHVGKGLQSLVGLPVLAVGSATARAAENASLTVAMTGEDDAATLIAAAATAGYRALLHLGGRDTTIVVGGTVRASIPVYASDAVAIAPDRIAVLAGSVALLHSARAARRLAELIDGAGLARQTTRLAAISAAVAAVAGSGWGAMSIAEAPNDAQLIDAAARLAD